MNLSSAEADAALQANQRVLEIECANNIVCFFALVVKEINSCFNYYSLEGVSKVEFWLNTTNYAESEENELRRK